MIFVLIGKMINIVIISGEKNNDSTQEVFVLIWARNMV